VEGALGAAASLLELSVFEAGFESPPSEPFDLPDE